MESITAGRIVRFFNDRYPAESFVAIVTDVNDDGTVNLVVLGRRFATGTSFEEQVPATGSRRWEWPSYVSAPQVEEPEDVA